MFYFKLKILSLVLTLLFSPLHAEKSIDLTSSQTKILGTSSDMAFGDIPLYFIPNHGQIDSQVLYYAVTSKYTIWLTRKGLVFDSALSIGRKKQELFFSARKNNEETRSFPGKRTISKLEFIDG